MLSEMLYTDNVMDEVTQEPLNYQNLKSPGLDGWSWIKHCQKECVVLAQQH